MSNRRGSCFNLAIEMLVISGKSKVSIISPQPVPRFNLAIEMLVISGSLVAKHPTRATLAVSISQSRCLSFQDTHWMSLKSGSHCFNLAIEMLVISGVSFVPSYAYTYLFQSRNRDACHFRWLHIQRLAAGWTLVSISQSRCLSFQVYALWAECWRAGKFQSRNRDACHFRNWVATLKAAQVLSVSISQSRCLSFQGQRLHWANSFVRCFNLAIEMLVISGPPIPAQLSHRTKHLFQSRNRDACHFRPRLAQDRG